MLHILKTHKYKSVRFTNRAIEVLKMVELPDPVRVMNAYPHELSGGAGRALIGMALACEPKLLIADEPTTALDVTIQAQIVDLFHQLRDRLDLTLVYITHNLDLMAELCDRAIVMKKGCIVEEGPVQTLFQSPKHAYTKIFSDCVPRLNDRAVCRAKFKKTDKQSSKNEASHLKRSDLKKPVIEFDTFQGPNAKNFFK